jgi:preprotein translocase subunit SecF
MATATKAKASGGLAHKLWTGQVSYDFIGNRKIWYTFSAIVLVFCIAGLFVRGLDLGIEFKGGSKFQVDVPAVTDTTVSEYRDAALNSGVENLNPEVTTIGGSKVAVETRSLNADEQIAVRIALGDQAGIDSEDVAYDQIGASWGAQVTQKAGIALVVFLVLVSILIGLYFRYWKMALSAILCLFHDLIVTVGVYAWVGFTITPATLTGVLTILGYSLYDTVVVFDKVRENWAELEESRLTYAEAANKADNQVLMRSINTTIIGVLPVAALLFAGAFALGSGPLEDIGLALFVGMIAGAYSSIFLATPLLAQLKDLEPAVKEHTARVERRRTRSKRVQLAEQALQPGFRGQAADDDDEDDDEGASLVTITTDEAPEEPAPAKASTPRVQPKKVSRSQRKK